MRISYDAEVDALIITFRETTVTTKPLAEGIAADYDSNGLLAGTKRLDAVKRFGGQDSPACCLVYVFQSRDLFIFFSAFDGLQMCMLLVEIPPAPLSLCHT